MAEPAVIVEKDGPVLIVTLNRPEKRNAVTAEVMGLPEDAKQSKFFMVEPTTTVSIHKAFRLLCSSIIQRLEKSKAT